MQKSSQRPRIRIRLKTGGGPVGRPAPVSELGTGRIFGRELFQSVYDGILLTHKDGQILDANPRAVTLLHRSVDDLRTLCTKDVLAGADDGMITSLLPALNNGRFALIEAYGLRPDRDAFPAEVAVSLLRPDPAVLCFFIRDITRRRQAEDLMRTGFNALKHASNGIAVLDTRGRIRYANTALARIWHVEGEGSLLNRDFADLVDEPDRAQDLLDQAVRDHREWHGEICGRRTDETTFPCLVAAAGNRDTDGEWTGAVLSLTDLTDVKRAEQVMREDERKRAMLASLGAACHHLAQPATVVLGNLGLLEQMRDGIPEEIRMLIDTSAEAAEELARVLHKLNEIEVYRTVHYLEDETQADRPDNQLLQI